jgi:hypothetical protein
MGERTVTKLSRLQQQLAALGRRRSAARQCTAWASVATVVLWLLAVVFLVDWWLELTRGQRFVALLAVAGLTAWAFWRLARPWLGQRESLIDVALLVQRHRNIDSDLVAAIQFENANRSEDAAAQEDMAAHALGSARLRDATIDQVAQATSGWSLMADFPRQTMFRRLALLAATLLIAAIGVAAAPGHAAVFANRLAFGSRHYPTDTVIQYVTINGRRIKLVENSEVTTVARCPFGQPVDFLVECGGEQASGGRIVLRPTTGGEVVVPLKESEESAGLVGRLAELVGPVEFSIEIGDSWTDPARIDAMPLPLVELTLRGIAPEYIQTGESTAESSTSKRQIDVFEGSRVEMELTCANKSLKSVKLVIDENEYPLTSDDENAQTWRLAAEGSPLAEIVEPVTYQILATDTDDLPPGEPIEGMIRIRRDRAPTIEADIAKQHKVFVLPTAEPRIHYRIDDDFGISGLTLYMSILRAAGGPEESHEFNLFDADEPVTAERLPHDQQLAFPLSSFSLAKGDRIDIVLEATDHRGSTRQGSSRRAKPLSLFVTDRAGAVVAFTGDADQETDRMIRKIIERTTGIERHTP